MALLTLTQQETLLAFELDESQVEMVRADAGGSYIERSDPHNTGYNGNPLFVVETPAQIAAQAENLIPLIISKTGDQWTSVYLNGSVNHFGSVQADSTTVLGHSRFEYFHNGNTMEIYLAQEYTNEISSMLQQIENGAKNPVAVTVGLTGAGYTLTAADIQSGFVLVDVTAAGTLTLPSASDFATAVGAGVGTTAQLIIYNIGGFNGTIALGLNNNNSAVNPVDTGAGAFAAGEMFVYQYAFTSLIQAKVAQLV